MPPVNKLADLPDTLKTYAAHGIDLNYRKGVPEAVGTCPFCARDNKFSVKIETGQWRCLVCNEGPEKDKSIRGGNAVVFLRTLYRLSKEAMASKAADLAQLAASRGFLSAKILESWGVVKSISSNEWLIPGYNPEGAMCQLYRYVKLGDKLRLLATPPSPTLQHQIHGLNFWGKSKEVVFVCEGPWDGMALHEVLSQTKSTENGLAATGNVKLSLFNEVNIVALPGCNTFKPQWSKLFENKRVVVLFDNDHPKKNEATGKMVPPASIEGLKRFCEIVSSSETPPASLEYLKWGEAGYAETLPSGMDLRDSFMNSGKLLGSRIKALDKILGKISPVPSEWVKSTPEAVRSSPRESLCIPCDSYKELITAWRKAMKWTDGLDCALSVMLASVTSVRLVGDQLWVKIIGPASCLAGDTPIYDPTNNSTMTVRRRWELQNCFSVYSQAEGLITVKSALPPEKFEAVPIFKVTFSSGYSIRVTEGHQFWDGNKYLKLSEINLEETTELPSIRECSLPVTWAITSSNLITTHILSIEPDGVEEYFDFHVPETNNYWACGVFNHNCGKTSIAKALGTASDYVLCEDVIRGFTSGWRAEAGEDAKGYDLATRIKNKTMITMDGDTLMQSPNLSNILGEGRRLYDGQLSSHFKNGMGKSVDQHRFTWIICGTSSLRSMDSSELGERFLDCVIMEGIDDDLEDEILLRVANRTVRNMSTEVSDRVGSMEDPEMEAVMNLTGGYVEWLRKNAAIEMSSVETTDKALHFCTRLGKFVAFMRARPSSIQDEVAEREFAARLVTQHIRLATCLAVVMNKKSVDQDVLRRTQKVAFDTARGRTVELTRHLYEAGENGLEVKALAHYTNNTEAEVRKLLKFLRDIGVTSNFIRKAAKGISGKPVWILTPKLIKLWKEVHQIQ